MKRILSLTGAPPGLARFREEAAEKTWAAFGDYEGGTAKRELAAALADRQRGLCCYCEIALKPDDRQVEHLVPRSHLALGSELAVDPTNLLACCKGGSNRSFAADTRSADAARHLEPVKENLSCGQAKDNLTGPGMADPRRLPAAPSVYVVRPDGRIEADLAACRSAGIAPEEVAETIALLRLDNQRLRNQRQKIWKALEGLPLEPDILAEAARRELLPQADGSLHAWFTTIRSFFGPLAEAVLEQAPQDWIAA